MKMDVMPSLYFVVLVLLVVLITVPALKYAMERYPVPGLADLVKAV